MSTKANALSIVAYRTSVACPCQYEGNINGFPFYFRGRGGEFRIDVVPQGCCPVEAENPIYHNEGDFDDNELYDMGWKDTPALEELVGGELFKAANAVMGYMSTLICDDKRQDF
jgi:hypothetical protein